MQDNPYPYIRRADLYVQPSRFEGYPMTVLEALVLGKPIVSTDNGGAGEMLTEGVTGTLCPISSEGIAQAVHDLLNDQTLLNQMRRNVENTDFESQNRAVITELERLMICETNRYTK